MSDKAIKTPIENGGLGWYSIGNEEIEAINELLRDPIKLWRYTENSYSFRVEKLATSITGAKHALFVNSGTSALACCLSSLQIGPGDEVIVSAYTYIATASACLEVGAIPVICEIDESLGIDPNDLEKRITPFTKAVIITHMQGVPGRLAQVREVVKKHNLKLIEDCCQAIGAKYNGKHCGVESDAFAWSLNYYKIITCGEGGIFFTNDEEGYALGYYQSDPASVMWKSGYGEGAEVPIFTRACYRSSELCGAVAYVQLGKLESILAHTRKLKKVLLANLDTPINYRLQHVDDPEGDCGISFAMIAINTALCEKLTKAMALEGLHIGSLYSENAFPDRHIFRYWTGVVDKSGATSKNYPWNDPLYKGSVAYSDDMCPNTLDILSRSMRLTIHLGMTEQNMLEIAEAINRADKSI